MVETGAREKTSYTQENQTAAEQRETEELRDAGVELKMSAWLFLLLLSLSECNCVSFWAWDEDQKAQNRKKNLFVPIQTITWEEAKADLLPRSAGTFHPSEHPENTTRDKSHLDIFLNLNYGAWEANMAN